MRRVGFVVAALAAVATMAAMAEPSALEGVKFLSVSVEPVKEVVGQCPVSGVPHTFKVHPDDVVRLRVEAAMADGSYRDLTVDSALHYRSSQPKAARVTRTGVVKFYVSRMLARPLSISITAGGLAQTVDFTVITGSHLDLPAEANQTLEHEFPGFRVPLEQDVVNDWAIERGDIPFAARRDFDGNGLLDYALVLVSEREWRIVILGQRAGGTFDVAYSEGGVYGSKGGLTCPQQIHLLPADLEDEKDRAHVLSSELRVETYGGDFFTLRWNGTQYERNREEYGE